MNQGLRKYMVLGILVSACAVIIACVLVFYSRWTINKISKKNLKDFREIIKELH